MKPKKGAIPMVRKPRARPVPPPTPEPPPAAPKEPFGNMIGKCKTCLGTGTLYVKSFNQPTQEMGCDACGGSGLEVVVAPQSDPITRFVTKYAPTRMPPLLSDIAAEVSGDEIEALLAADHSDAEPCKPCGGFGTVRRRGVYYTCIVCDGKG